MYPHTRVSSCPGLISVAHMYIYIIYIISMYQNVKCKIKPAGLAVI